MIRLPRCWNRKRSTRANDGNATPARLTRRGARAEPARRQFRRLRAQDRLHLGTAALCASATALLLGKAIRSATPRPVRRATTICRQRSVRQRRQLGTPPLLHLVDAVSVARHLER